jgi:hypothetical protein
MPNWSWKLISIYRIWFPISKTNLPNWTKFLISSLQFDSAKILFFKIILIQVDLFNLLIFNLQQFNLIHEDSTQFDQILIRWKIQISWSYPLFNSTVYPNSYFPYWGPKRKLSPKNSISFFDDRERILLRISIIRANGLPDRNTDFPFFCLPNWAIQSIDRNKQNSGSKTNSLRFSKAGFISNPLFFRFLFPKWSAPNGPATCCAGF